MRKIIGIVLLLACICSAAVTAFANNTAVEVNLDDYNYSEPITYSEDLDGDGSEDWVSVSEYEVEAKHYAMNVEINGESHTIELGPTWIRQMFVADMNTADATKEIVFINGYHSYSWAMVLRYENGNLNIFKFNNYGEVSDYSTSRPYRDLTCEVTTAGDGTLVLTGEILENDEMSYIVDKYVEIDKGVLARHDDDINLNPGISVVYNGENVEFDQQPVIKNDRTLVPLRAIFELLGADVSWDGETQTVTAVKGKTTISLMIGDYAMFKNGESILLDAPGMVINDRTLVPVRAVSEALDCGVEWDESTKTVTIITEN